MNTVDEVKETLDNNLVDTLSTTETKIDSTVISSTLLSLQGYRIVSKDRKKSAGGIIAYIKAGLSHSRRSKLE